MIWRIPLTNTRVRPHVARVLERTHAVLITFDGTLCELFIGVDTAAIAEKIHNMLVSAGHRMSILTGIADEPLWKMGYAYHVGPTYGAEAEEIVRDAEVAAALTAVPTPGAQEVLQACQDSGRGVAVAGDTCSAAVETYLDTHGLRQLVGPVIGRERRPTLSEWPGVDLVRQAVQALGVEPSNCTLVSMSVLGMYVAAEAGTKAIGVVGKKSSRKHLAGVHGSVAVSTLPQLADALRAVPIATPH
jgi:beta-phosphoglucomutase-like phosphatase (HAD superfamily)